jgi:molecular chaperone HscC
LIIGIDLGTTNSAVGVWRHGKIELVPNSLGDFLTPSVVGVSDKDEILVGLAARERQPTHPHLTASVFKRLMGTKQRTRLGDRTFAPEELSALVLQSLRADVEAHFGTAVTSAVITVPAYFNDRQRKATRRAGQLAGLKVERLINEPTAAALAHGIYEREDKEPFLIFDLGGGTFDVSIVEIFERIVEVRASAGDNRLGGEDFNDVVAAIAARQLGLSSGTGEDSRIRELLRAAAERTRRALSSASEAAFQVVIDGERLETVVTAADFEAQAEPHLARLRDPVLRSLRDSGIRTEQLSEVILVGGATRMPIVRKTVARMFGRFPSGHVDPDLAVATGAAVQAGLRAKDSDLEEVRLTDVCPFTLGIDVAEVDRAGFVHTGQFSPIIERNTIVPASRVRTFATVQDGQAMVQFGIFQGEARLVAQNVRLGTVRIPVPARPAGEIQVDCRFSYDASGLLEVDVHVPDSGLREQLVIHDGVDDQDDLPARRDALQALKVHPREDAANQAALARATRCYEMLVRDVREHVGRLIIDFEHVLDRQDPRQVKQARLSLEEQLDAIEGERFL